MEHDIFAEQQKISQILKSIRFDSMQQAKRVMEQLVYEYRWPSVNDLLMLLFKDKHVPQSLPFGDQYVWTDLKHDILSNKYGAAYRQDSRTKRAYFVLQLPVPERIDETSDYHQTTFVK